ncbi:putative DNA-3-methyladenine glycosylase II [Helianthus annuus]|nr:putative DNA-3-methyladenine glycosylase II [Helianthus annuus]
MKITKRFNRVIKPLKPINTSTSDSKPHTIKPKPNLNPKSKTKPRTLKQSNLYPKPTFILEKAPILGPDFYQIDALDLAPRLLGKYLKRDDVVLQITEVVEAYRSNDSACHGRVGVTPRTAPLFGPGGHAYVYLCYGMHNMLNVVADKQGIGSAVLIRSCAPVTGWKLSNNVGVRILRSPFFLPGPARSVCIFLVFLKVYPLDPSSMLYQKMFSPFLKLANNETFNTLIIYQISLKKWVKTDRLLELKYRTG